MIGTEPQLVFRILPNVNMKYCKFSPHLKILWGERGVYKIYENDKVVYIGKAVNLYNKIARHFQSHTDSKSRKKSNYQDRIKQHTYKFGFEVIEGTYSDIEDRQAQLINELKPRDNVQTWPE